MLFRSCTTRLRLVVADQARIDEAGLKAEGARGVLRLADGGLQVVFGPIADQIAGETRAAMSLPQSVAAVPVSVEEEAAYPAIRRALGEGNVVALLPRGTRLIATLRDPALADETALHAAGVRLVARQPESEKLHLLLQPPVIPA